ncbi:MAG: nucleotide sugar dehydrogenase [Vicinamibacterales bacterium]
MKINIHGLGYVGSVSAACLAADGHDVRGVDIDARKVGAINSGVSPVREPGLPELLAQAVEAGRLTASDRARDDAEVSMICVGTPSNENGSLCLDHVLNAIGQIAQMLRTADGYHVVCVRSTVIPGTVESVVVPALERDSGKKAGRDFGVCMNPEFLREGTSIEDYRHPPYTVIGELDERSGDTISRLYEDLPAPVIRTKLAVAEMVKYAGNAFHALKITFANEMGVLCKRLGIDGTEVFNVFCEDRKLNISPAYLRPGFAFGGSCLPKDLRALLYRAKELDCEPLVLRSILASNEGQINEAYRLIKRTGKKKVAMLGLSFKAGTDDLRESPVAELVELLVGKGHDVAIYDQDVAPGRLHGSNRAYIEQTIPHFSRLMRQCLHCAIAESEVVVVAKRTAEIDERLATMDDDKVIIDLVRAIPGRGARNGQAYEGICW